MNRARAIVVFERGNCIPTALGWSEIADVGNLPTYGPSLRQSWRQAAGFVDRLMRGFAPQALPVEHPVHVKLVIKLQTSAAPGLTVPRALSLRAERLLR